MATMSKNISTVFQHTAVKKTEWQTVPLAELLLPQTTINPLLSPDKTFTYIDVSSVSPKTSIIQEPQVLLGKDAPSRARKVVLKNDVIFATIRPTMKRVALIPEELDNQICSTGYVVLRPKPALHPRYLFYWLFTKRFSDEMASLQRGASYPAVSDVDVRQQPIQFPQRAEQERIVAILDEAFDGIVQAAHNTEQNLLNAQSIFDDSVKLLMTSEELDWPHLTLGDICQVERGSSPRPIKNYFTTEPDGVNWIKIGDTLEGEKYIYSTNQRITPEGAKQSRFVQEGDFVLTNSMSFGRSYIMKTSGYIHDGWFLLRLKSSIDRDYLYYLLSSKYIRDQFKALASGSVVLNISGDLVKRARLPIPSIEEQSDLVSRLDTIAAETKSLQTTYERKMKALDALKQSLLSEAFSGNL